ncbi:237_t:CDS:2 [Ambispora gerdemannii]|uniref:237_t:CDS:1 n=1 Tax=Ambispora gerdemannii TaxID=144530 RepID=A0A9N8WD44_9GLOM|nr:237_t:CDS:2 [Ambispora gerdemannii]
MSTPSGRENFFSGTYIGEIIASWCQFIHKLMPEEEFEGQEISEFHPNLWNFIYSHYLYLAIFVNVLNNRINAIVAPRNPRPLTFTTRLFLRLPCFFLMVKASLVLISRIADDVSWFQKHVSNFILSYSVDYTDHQALWLCLKALAAVYVMKAFHSSLENRNLPGREQATNLYEWALLFHLYASPNLPNVDLIIIALLELLDAFALELLYLHSRGTQYRLIPTSIIGIIGIIHFAYALRFSTSYPLLQSVARFPELALICVIIMCAVLHGVAIVATGGNLRGRFFLDSRSLPSLNQDYTMALYSIGMACVEATRTDGYRNELNPIAVPMGTVFEASRRRRKIIRRRPTSGFDNEQIDSNGLTTTHEPDNNPLRITVMTNFAYNLIQVASDCGSWILNRLPIPFLARRNDISNQNLVGVQTRSEGVEEYDPDAELYERTLISTSADENSALLVLIQQRRELSEVKQPITDRLCVICHAEPRQCLLKPCSCFALCNDCREVMAQKRFKTCPCCRRTVEGWCKIYVP